MGKEPIPGGGAKVPLASGVKKPEPEGAVKVVGEEVLPLVEVG
jgi:hypothetical protein